MSYWSNEKSLIIPNYRNLGYQNIRLRIYLYIVISENTCVADQINIHNLFTWYVCHYFFTYTDKEKSYSAGLQKHQQNLRECFKMPASLADPMLLADLNTTRSLQRCDLLTGPQAALLINLLTILFQRRLALNECNETMKLQLPCQFSRYVPQRGFFLSGWEMSS